MLMSVSKSLRKLAQEKNIGLATAHKAVREETEPLPIQSNSGARIETGLYRCSWTSLPTPFISAQRLSESTVLTFWHRNFFKFF
jgi:hypothetical protein